MNNTVLAIKATGDSASDKGPKNDLNNWNVQIVNKIKKPAHKNTTYALLQKLNNVKNINEKNKR